MPEEQKESLTVRLRDLADWFSAMQLAHLDLSPRQARFYEAAYNTIAEAIEEIKSMKKTAIAVDYLDKKVQHRQDTLEHYFGKDLLKLIDAVVDGSSVKEKKA